MKKESLYMGNVMFIGQEEPQIKHRRSDSDTIPGLHGQLHRSLERGPLVIPDHVQSQYRQSNAQHRRSSAESLVAKVCGQFA